MRRFERLDPRDTVLHYFHRALIRGAWVSYYLGNRSGKLYRWVSP